MYQLTAAESSRFSETNSQLSDMVNDDIVAALDGHVRHLPNKAITASREALSPLIETFDQAEVIGLGEATHGTREFFEWRRRIVRTLIEELGFRRLAFEAGVTGMLAVDEIVRDTSTDVDKSAVSVREGPEERRLEEALAGLHAWPWQVQSVRAILEWVRSFNEGRQLNEQVRIHGIDLRIPATPANALLQQLQEVDVIPIPNDLVRLGQTGKRPPTEAGRDEYLDRAETAATAVFARLEDNRAEFIDQTSKLDWERVRTLAKVIIRTCEWHRVRHDKSEPHEAGMTARDRMMAANVTDVAQRSSGGVVVFCHNLHVGRGSFDDGSDWSDGTTMGQRLATEFNDRYRVVGFDFDRGSFRATRRGDDGPPEYWSIGDPNNETLTAAFEKLGGSTRLLDLQSASDDPTCGDWLIAERRIRSIGSSFDPNADPISQYQSTILPETYDWICSVKESSPTKPLNPGD